MIPSARKKGANGALDFDDGAKFLSSVQGGSEIDEPFQVSDKYGLT